MTPITTLFSLPITAGLDWLAGLAFADLDPPGLDLPCASATPPLHGDVGEEDAFSGEVAKKHDVVVVGDVVGVSLLHPSSPSASPHHHRGQFITGEIADVREVFEKFANSQGG